MKTNYIPRLRSLRPLALLSLLMATPFLAGCPGGNSGPITIESPKYKDIARAFAIGLISLEVGDAKRAPKYLTELTKLAPDEPAGWANLGISQLRGQEGASLADAAASLEKAQQMAPTNSRILASLGIVYDRQGKFADAVNILKKAVDADPNNLRALYALYNASTKQGGDGDDILKKILEKQPSNLVVLLERTRNAAKKGDKAAVEAGVAELTKYSKNWPEQPKARLSALAAAAKGNVRAAAPEVLRLKNVLLTVVEFRQSSRAVEGSNEQPGLPVMQLVKYPPLPATPAAPDSGLTYAVEAGKSEGKGEIVRAVSLNGEGNPILRVAATEFIALDFDYDFESDIASVGPKGFQLLKGVKGVFSDVTTKTGLPATVTKAAYTGVWAADVDMDGDLDILLATKDKGVTLLQNNGDSTFKAIKQFTELSGATAFAWGDVDGDGDPDAVFIDGAGKLVVYSNERNGLFSQRQMTGGLESVSAVTLANLGKGSAMDIIALKSDGSVVRVSDEGEGRTFTAAELVKTTVTGGGTLFVADLDNNGSNDLAVSDGKQTVVYLSDATGAFPTTPGVTVALGAQDIADVNGDGTLDIVGIANGQVSQALGKGTKNYRYLVIRPRADASAEKPPRGDQRINSFGIGGEIEVRAGLLAQKQRITSPLMHFGLGDQTAADFLRIVWPNGSPQGEFDTDRKGAPITGNIAFGVIQRLKGSCPFLFTWDGEKMAFVTDCIWRSPLGLKINAQATAGVAMTSDWVKIRGDQLKPRTDADGKPYYDLRVTADLWETHFFDHLSLMTVDHPQGTDIWVDERFTIPPPPLAVITTTKLTPIARATADTGEDMTETLHDRDGRYADYFGRGRYQGVTRDHTLTLDLGKVAKSGKGPLYLIAHGWIHPTDSSINVAISQGKNPPPTGLSIEIPDGKGGWKTAKAGLGFPTGKVKTVVLRVDDVLKGGTVLRLRTNLEIFWDSIGTAHGIDAAPIQKQKLLAEKADLQYRGFTTVQAVDTSSPEVPVAYEPIENQGQRWRDLVGYYTRFGDVRELLKGIDDRYIIMNAGDEIRMRFAVPAPPKPGYVRDYILVGDGWVKDGDLNTTYSTTVLPLPTHAKPDYDRRPTTLEDDPVYKQHPQDWDTYHTRYITPDQFRDALQSGRESR